MDQESQGSEVASRGWFDHMTGYLKWKVVGPDIKNPFKTPPPPHILRRMFEQVDFLSQFIQIRCLCDGYEVMSIFNPYTPRIQSDHPSISRMSLGEVVGYLERAGIDEFINSEIKRIQSEIAEKIKNYDSEQDNEDTHILSKSKKKSKKVETKKPNGQQYRLIKKR